MPLTTTEAQKLHEAGAAFASRSADLREAEADRANAEVRGERPTEQHHRAVEVAQTAWRRAHTRFHGLIDDLKETP